MPSPNSIYGHILAQTTRFGNPHKPKFRIYPAGNRSSLVIALIAGFLGFGGVAFAAAGIAKILFFIFLVIFAIALVTGFAARRRPPI